MLILWVVVSGALWNIGIAFGHEHWLVPASGMMGSLPQVNLLENGMVMQGVVSVWWCLKSISPLYRALILSYLRYWDISQSTGPTIVWVIYLQQCRYINHTLYTLSSKHGLLERRFDVSHMCWAAKNHRLKTTGCPGLEARALFVCFLGAFLLVVMMCHDSYYGSTFVGVLVVHM